ncbi:signal recognition particle receptor FtsY-like [Rattus rattus]|uniref:signal recognition particle receptor FtsY-like n=1 Tax=Rattus rattus TaxID=10117 RepID=UPI0013F307A8|nr:signal recognition particle receptor FtsY-like [Rattus rattus]
MSKSKKNVIDPIELLDIFPRDAIRFYLMKFNCFRDNQVGVMDIYEVYNGYLANTYGNLISRFYGIVGRKFNLVIPNDYQVENFIELDQLNMQFKSFLDTDYENLVLQNSPFLVIEKIFDMFRSAGKKLFARNIAFFKNIFQKIRIDHDVQEQIEEALLGLDFGPALSEKLSKDISFGFSKTDKTMDSLKKSFSESLLKFYGDNNTELNIQKGRTNVLLMVGANGSGKTTSIAKLASHFKDGGYRTMIVAGDTFRAGAVEQLDIWAKRLGIDIFLPLKHKEDPSALIYRAFQSNQKNPYDLIIIDTSGKQHNNQNLLNELNKVHKTIGKFGEDYPHEVLLVMDSTIGQTSIFHAEQFLNYAHITGIILSKMDQMSRGGMIFAIKHRFNVPVKLMGTGETLNDLEEFDLKQIVSA